MAISSSINTPIPRRRFLQSGAIALAIPQFAASPIDAQKAKQPKRLFAISNNLGFLPRHFFPKTSGADYQPSKYLAELQDVRNHFTVFTGLSHPACEGGHSTENCFLTAAKHPTSTGFRNSISLDQFIANQSVQRTRFDTINLGINIDKAHRSLAWTRDGALIPAEDSPANLFKRMFLAGSPTGTEQAMARIARQQSVLDDLREARQAQDRKLGRRDRARLDQYLESIRELEQRLLVANDWLKRPKPKTDVEPPTDITDQARFIEKFDQMVTMAKLAFESDSTRVVTLMVDAFATPQFHLSDDQKTESGYHNLSHHGQREHFLADLENIDLQQMRLMNKLLQSLQNTATDHSHLLDETMVLLGSNMGNANTHTNTNLPILLAGGALKHRGHISFNSENNTPLSNLFVTILQQIGVEADRFGSSTGSLDL